MAKPLPHFVQVCRKERVGLRGANRVACDNRIRCSALGYQVFWGSLGEPRQVVPRTATRATSSYSKRMTVVAYAYSVLAWLTYYRSKRAFLDDDSLYE